MIELAIGAGMALVGGAAAKYVDRKRQLAQEAQRRRQRALARHRELQRIASTEAAAERRMQDLTDQTMRSMLESALRSQLNRPPNGGGGR